jgi:hypothetical protein
MGTDAASTPVEMPDAHAVAITEALVIFMDKTYGKKMRTFVQTLDRCITNLVLATWRGMTDRPKMARDCQVTQTISPNRYNRIWAIEAGSLKIDFGGAFH